MDLTLQPGEVFRDRSEWTLGVDLGQASDPTAIAAVERRTVDALTERGPAHRLGACRQLTETFDVRHLQRLPLGLSYVEVVEEVRRLLARPPLAPDCLLVLDETGVGRPVGDLFDDAGLAPVRVTITAGSGQSGHGRRRWTVAKGLLIANVDARLHTGELRFASALREAGAMAGELKDFRRKVSAAGRFQYEARVGQHDDLVLAVAIALWAHVGRPKPVPAAVGSYGMSTTGALS